MKILENLTKRFSCVEQGSVFELSTSVIILTLWTTVIILTHYLNAHHQQPFFLPNMSLTGVMSQSCLWIYMAYGCSLTTLVLCISDQTCSATVSLTTLLLAAVSYTHLSSTCFRNYMYTFLVVVFHMGISHGPGVSMLTCEQKVLDLSLLLGWVYVQKVFHAFPLFPFWALPHNSARGFCDVYKGYWGWCCSMHFSWSCIGNIIYCTFVSTKATLSLASVQSSLQVN